MDAAERSQAAPSSTAFDGFISYSHAADDLLAPRLQAALQKFAKPWWKRRAVRIFRDESSLAANPHLWSSITDALDDSGWFVLLLSPDAASSEWVGKEIGHWVENKPADRILPVVTDGDFHWENGEITGSSVPPALHGVFGEEPRWVDLRFAQEEELLDLQNPDFSAAVADIAATIRGVPKDELASEEVRQHRRTVRTAWAAGALVTILAIAAAVAGVFAIEQRNDAQDNAARATENERIAQKNAREAQENGRLAFARELAASAFGVLDDDPQLATLLSLEAIHTTPAGNVLPTEVINAIWKAGSANRLVGAIPHGFLSETLVEVSDDGSRLLFAAQLGPIRLYDTASLSVIWEVEPPTGLSTAWASINPDGSMVAVPMVRTDDQSEGISRVSILDGATGSVIHEIAYEQCDGANYSAWSAAGDILAVSTMFAECPRAASDSGFWVEVLDTADWNSLAVIEVESQEAIGVTPHFDESGRLFVLGASTHVYDSETYQLQSVIPSSIGFGDIAPDGSLVATFFPFGGEPGLAVFDVETGARIDLLTPFDEWSTIPNGVRFSTGGTYLIVGNEAETTLVWEVATGDPVMRLPGGTSDAVWFDEGTERAYTAHRDDGTVKVWNVGDVGFGRTPLGDLGDVAVRGEFQVHAGLGNFVVAPINTQDYSLRFFEGDTGRLLDGEHPTFNPAGWLSGRYIHAPEEGLWVALDPVTFEQETFFDCRPLAKGHCFARTSIDSTEIVIPLDEEAGRRLIYLNSAGDQIAEQPGSLDRYPIEFGPDWVLSLSTDERDLFITDREDGEAIASWVDGSVQSFQVSPSGQQIFYEAPMRIIDVGTWTARDLPAVSGNVRGAEFSSDERYLALSTNEDAIHILDLESDTIRQTIPIPEVSDIHWLNAETILIGTRAGEWSTVSLDIANVIEAAAGSVTRTFTELECSLYRIDPCPTLEEIRSR